jgi:hypothetical protein
VNYEFFTRIVQEKHNTLHTSVKKLKKKKKIWEKETPLEVNTQKTAYRIYYWNNNQQMHEIQCVTKIQYLKISENAGKYY